MANFKEQLISFTNMVNPANKIDQVTADAKTELDAAKEAAIAYGTVDLGLKLVTVGVLIGILYYTANPRKGN